MAISSNTIFHFTMDMETLKNILTCNYIWPRYCTEYSWGGFSFALPMACFCDIPLSQISEHINFYGNYGIGLSKAWSERIKELSSVLYVKTKSHIGNHVAYCLRKNQQNLDKLSKEDFIILSRIKKYSGNARNKDGKTVSKIFYNEREWRYVPSDLEPKDLYVRHGNDRIEIEESKNIKFKEKLHFQLNDIKYLIISKESERVSFLKTLEKIYCMNNSANIDENFLLLASKIITCEQIKKDF